MSENRNIAIDYVDRPNPVINPDPISYSQQRKPLPKARFIPWKIWFLGSLLALIVASCGFLALRQFLEYKYAYDPAFRQVVDLSFIALVAAPVITLVLLARALVIAAWNRAQKSALVELPGGLVVHTQDVEGGWSRERPRKFAEQTISQHYKIQAALAEQSIFRNVTNYSPSVATHYHTYGSKVEALAEKEALPRTLPQAEWLSLVNERLDDAPHLLVLGPTGTGKTTLAAAILAARAGQVLILDPKPTPLKWGGVPFISVDDEGEYEPIEKALQSVLAERKRRQAEMKEGKKDFEQLTLVIDDFPDVKNECPSAPILLKRLGSMGRELRIRVLALTQSSRVKTLGIEGEGDARENYTIIRLGSFAIEVLPAANEMQRPATLEWRGEQHPIDTLGLAGSHNAPIPPERWWIAPEPQTDQEVLADLLTATPATAPQRKDRIRELFEQDPAQELSAKDVAEMLGLSRAASVREHLRALVAEGVLTSGQELRSGQPTEVYTLAGRQADETE